MIIANLNNLKKMYLLFFSLPYTDATLQEIQRRGISKVIQSAMTNSSIYF